ncbi:MAG: hypothetical protein II628_10040, partial [Lachnospiraceae bacterium]|nr:hypothetical protein [Lachnospiraceae bacterium]
SLLFHVKHLSTGYFTPGIRNYLTDFPENKSRIYASPSIVSRETFFKKRCSAPGGTSSLTHITLPDIFPDRSE